MGKVDLMINLLITDAGGPAAIGVLKSLKNTKDDMLSAVTITDENVLTASKFKHEVVGKEFLEK